MKRKIKHFEALSAFAIFLLVLVLELTGAAFSLSAKTEDAAYQSPVLPNQDICVIGIDEFTLNEYGVYDTWIRQKTADLINFLCEEEKDRPAVIAVDIGFFSHRDEESDAALTEAVKNAGNVVLICSGFFSENITVHEDGSYSTSISAHLLEEPYDELKAVCAGMGHINIQPDRDGVVRHASGSFEIDGRTVYSLDEIVYTQYTGKHSDAPDDSFYISYSGLPRDYFGMDRIGLSMLNVLNGKYPSGTFRDKIVFIGAYAAGMQDSFPTPISSERMNGVEIHANILNQLLTGRHMTQAPKAVRAAVLAALLVILVVLTYLPTKLSYIFELALGGVYFGAAKLIAINGYLMPLFEPLLLILLVCVASIFIRYYGSYAERKRLIANYGKYLSPEVAATISAESESDLKLGGIKRDIAVLFVDIRGFTTLSEKQSPERVMEMLNSYLKLTTNAIFKNQGTVDKFIGDATMGVFNSPLELEDYTYKAVLSGLDMVVRAGEMDSELPDELKSRVGFGIGINCGEAVIGNVGADFRMEYTAIGDTVNVASRLEGIAKAGEVIISEAVYERVKERIECEPMGEVMLKGKEKPVKIYKALREAAK